MSLSTEAILKYLETPSQLRPAVSFNPAFLDKAQSFAPDQADRLLQLADARTVLTPRHVEQLTIDLSWASSHLEGNSYSQIDTEALINWGRRNPDKPAEDAVMILNHKSAIQELLLHVAQPLSIPIVQRIHTALADPRETTNSRHFLEKDLGGVLREFGDVYITGSSYIPSGTMGSQLVAELNRVVSTAERADPMNGAVYLMTRLPYLQPFLDGNKRTSRLVANLPLLKAGLNPFSFVGIDKTRYIQGMVAFYELGDDRLVRDAFIDAYGHTALCSKTSTAEHRVVLTNEREEVVKQLKAYILDGARPEHEVLVELIPEPHDLMQPS